MDKKNVGVDGAALFSLPRQISLPAPGPGVVERPGKTARHSPGVYNAAAVFRMNGEIVSETTSFESTPSVTISEALITPK